jgi:hypothetical protein
MTSDAAEFTRGVFPSRWIATSQSFCPSNGFAATDAVNPAAAKRRADEHEN